MELTMLTILICDDSMLVRKKLRDLLEKLGCRVLEAKNGLEGFETYKINNPHAVFMDIVMPELDGLESLKRIKAHDPKAKVIMLSSVGTASKLKDALKTGAIDFIQKPYDDEQIKSILTQIFDKERSHV